MSAGSEMDVDMMDHPEDELLIAHAAGDLETVAAMPVIAHLAGCRVCARLVERYAVVRQTVRGDDSAPVPAALMAGVHAMFAAAQPTLRSRIADAAAPARRLVASLAFDSWGRMAPGFAAVRGEGDGRQFSWSAGDLDVDVQVLPAAPGVASLRLVGQVGGHDGAVGIVTLARESGEAVAISRADEFGAFSLSAPAGTYDLELVVDGELVILPGVELG